VNGFAEAESRSSRVVEWRVLLVERLKSTKRPIAVRRSLELSKKATLD